MKRGEWEGFQCLGGTVPIQVVKTPLIYLFHWFRAPKTPPGKSSSLLHGLVTNLTMAIAITIAKNSQDPPRLWLTDSCEPPPPKMLR